MREIKSVRFAQAITVNNMVYTSLSYEQLPFVRMIFDDGMLKVASGNDEVWVPISNIGEMHPTPETPA